ncbi:MAG: dienelactone hydrolase family protein [Gemmatimonadota bacterium]|nr:dienelactone hydrolase family protein [Gemmatimonadota bacterium]
MIHRIVKLAAPIAGGLGVLAVVLAAARPAVDIHGEWVTYAGRSGDSVTAYVAYPERADPAPAVIVIHEIFGLSEWVRSVADSLAVAGFVAIAPDLLSRRGGTDAQANARQAIGGLPPDSVTIDLDATAAYLKSLKAVRGDAIGVIGFCWGGGQSFRYATNNPELKAAVVCYGPAPDLATVARIRAPVFGVYGENDARINAGLPDAERAMQAASKRYTKTIYPGTGHGFLRTREPADVTAGAWRDIVGFLRAELEQ